MSAPVTLDHVTIVSADFTASRAVYDAVLAAVGMTATVDFVDPEGEPDDTGTVAAIGYAAPGRRPMLWLVAGARATVGAHIAVRVAERALVHAAHKAAIAAGAMIVQAPREWEENQLDYFGLQLADVAGNLIEVLLRPARRS